MTHFGHLDIHINHTGAIASTFDLQVLRLASDEHILLLVQHHSITDGISLSIMLGELVLAYNAVLAGTTPQWDPLPLQCESVIPSRIKLTLTSCQSANIV